MVRFDWFVWFSPFSPNDKWSLLYRGTCDGFESRDFHSKCDGHSNTLTILKAKQGKFIFGGYTTVTWELSTNGKFKSDANAFLFSLTNNDNKPIKMNVDPDEHHRAIYNDSSCSPSFGGSIYIENNTNTTRIVFLDWIILISILNIHSVQMKLKHF